MTIPDDPSSSARRIYFLLILGLTAAIQAWTPSHAGAMTLTQVDGGPKYYARFSDGLPSDPSYFPIGVWFESVTSQRDIDLDKDAGLNTYLALTANSDVGLVRSNGMHAIIQSFEFTSAKALNGWFLADEFDMLYGPSTGYDQVQQRADEAPDDGRMRYSGYGKGVLFWETDAEAAQFVNNYQDVVQADAYFFTDNDVCDPSQAGGEPGIVKANDCHVAANYGWIIDRLQGLISPAGSKPVWAVVEVGHPFSEADWPSITPPQIRAAVWQSIIAGARGIIYFNHSFGGPNQTQHALREPPYAAERAVVKATNAQITELAPVLNSPTVRSGWSQGPGTTVMVKWAEGQKAKKGCKSEKGKGKKKCKKARGKAKQANAKNGCKPKKGRKCKKAKGYLYVFAGSQGSPVEGRFSLPCVGDTEAEVIGENRTIPVRKGFFSDHFADANAIHIYRIHRGSKCGRPRAAAVSGLGPSSGRRANTAPAPKTDLEVIAGMSILLAALLALFGIGRWRGLRRRRSGKPAKRSRHFAIR